MLYFFTDLYEDEIFFSAICRYKRYSGNLGRRKSTRNLFGTEFNNEIIMFPCYLKFFSNQFGEETIYTPENIIYKHTIFPLYSPFMPPKRSSELIEDMKSDKLREINIKIGEFTGGICKSIGFRVCLKCIEEDEIKYGEAYLHKEHQVPGNLVCYKHLEILREIIIPKYFVKTKYDIHNFEEENNYVTEKNFIYFKNLCTDIHRIFTCSSDDINFENLVKKYKVRLMQKGFASIKGIINWEKVNAEMLEFFPSDFLDILESNILIENKFTWTKGLLKQKILVHPIRHILFIEFLFGSINNIINFMEIEYKPFGEGPWPCLNPVAPHYKKEVVTDLEISNRSTAIKPLGIFKCECGYHYTRLGPDKNVYDRYLKRSVKCYGDLWRNELKKYIVLGNHNILEMSRIMDCDGKTIGAYAKDLGVFELLNSKMKTYELNNKTERRYLKGLEEQYKLDIITLIKENPNLKRSDVARKLRKQYVWMHRYRREWLYLILPQKTDKHIDYRKIKGYVDWEIRDSELSEKVLDVINDMKNNNRRITISGISKEIRYPIKKFISRLPHTQKILEDNSII